MERGVDSMQRQPHIRFVAQEGSPLAVVMFWSDCHPPHWPIVSRRKGLEHCFDFVNDCVGILQRKGKAHAGN